MRTVNAAIGAPRVCELEVGVYQVDRNNYFVHIPSRRLFHDKSTGFYTALLYGGSEGCCG